MLLLILLTVLLCACGGDEPSTEENPGLFEDFSIAEEIDTDWLFLPKEAKLLRTAENRKVLEAIFTGCEYPEINAYAKELFETLTRRGAKVYDAYELLTPHLLRGFKEAKLDINFAGVAYRYYYTYENRTYMLELKYYGSAGGNYGNGQSVIGISDVSGKIDSLIKE